MAIAPKAIRADYQSFNSAKGLTDVKGQVYVDGVAKAVGSNAVVFTELDATNSKGLYSYLATSALLASWGATDQSVIEIYTNSATVPAPAPIKAVIQTATAADVIAILGTPAGATLSADIAAIFARLGAPSGASVSADVASIIAAQATMTTQLQGLANAANTGGAGVVTLNGIIPASGSFALNVPVTIRDGNGNLVAPSAITVTMQNASGTDRGSYISGASGTPASLTPSATSTGLYNIPVSIPSTAVEEQLLMKVVFTVNGKQDIQFAGINVMNDVAGVAQQSTVTTIANNVASLLTKINDATNGLAAINANVQSATTAANTAATNALNAYTAAQNANTAIGNANTTLANIQGSNYNASVGSLMSLAAAIAAIPISGGRGV